jgi:hypothetical protein
VKRVIRAVAMTIGILILWGTIKGITDNGASNGQKVVNVGGRQVTIPNSTPKGVFAVTKALMAKTAYVPSYQRCILRQAEHLLTPAEAEELVHLPAAERERRGAEVFAKAIPHCAKPGQKIVDPNATAAELEPIRAQTAQSVKTILAEGRASPSKRACVSDQVNQMTDASLIELANGSLAVQTAILNELLKPCGLHIG